MSFIEEVKQDIEQYKRLDSDIQHENDQQLLRNTINLFREQAYRSGLNVMYRGQRLTLDLSSIPERRDIEIRYDSLPSNVFAWYQFGEKTCVFGLNKQVTLSGIKLHKEITHEAAHSLQDDSISTINQYDPSTIEYEYLFNLKATVCIPETERNVFGFTTSDRVYIDCRRQAPSAHLSDLNYAFYVLAISERYAFSMEENYSAKLSGQSTNNGQYDNAIQTIKQQYQLFDKTNREICEMIDIAHTSVYLGIVPNDKIVASMVYDLSASLSYQENHISKDVYVQSMSQSYKANQIAKFAIENQLDIVDVNKLSMDLDILNFLSIKNVEELNQHQLINNPQLIINLLVIHGEQIAPQIPDMELLKHWCYSEQNYFPDDIMMKVSEYLGEDFSPEVCKTQRDILTERNDVVKTSDFEEHKYIEQYIFDNTQFGSQEIER